MTAAPAAATVADVDDGAGAAAGPACFSTAGLPPAERVRLWEEHNAEELIGLRCRTLDGSALEATQVNLQLPRIHLARVTGNPHVVERTPEIIRRSPSGAVGCYLTLQGEAFFYHGDAARTLRPGQLLICDPDRPFMRGFSRGLEELAIKIPRQVFGEATGACEVPEPVVLDCADDARARGLARLVGQAVRARGARPVSETDVLRLVSGLTGERAEDPSAAHLAKARAFIEDRLADSGLSAARIADGIGLSERHLSRIFSSGGPSIPRYILARRLELAHRLLAGDPGLTVSETAARSGFASASYFSGAFRDRFGERPTDLRRRARQGTRGYAAR